MSPPQEMPENDCTKNVRRSEKSSGTGATTTATLRPAGRSDRTRYRVRLSADAPPALLKLAEDLDAMIGIEPKAPRPGGRS